LSPAFEKESYTSALESTPASAPAQSSGLKAAEPTKKEEAPVSSPTAENDGFVMVSHEDAKAASPTTSATPATSTPIAEPVPVDSAPSPSPPVSSAPASTTSVPPVRPTQPPKFTMSFASIAKAASSAASPAIEKKTTKVPAPQASKSAESKPAPESTPVKNDSKKSTKDVEVESNEDDGFITKTNKKSKKSSAKMPLPVSVKA
jgi:hypothetical protein